MSLLKTTAVFGAISGIGLIGFYLLRKSKPSISEQQLKDLNEFYILNDEREQKRKDIVKLAKYGIYKKIDTYDIFFLEKILNESPLELTTKEFNFLVKSKVAFLKKNTSSSSSTSETKEEDKRIKNLNLKVDFRKKNSSIISSNDENWAGAYNFYKPYRGNSFDLISLSFKNFFKELPNFNGQNIKVNAENCFDLDEKIKLINDNISIISKNRSLNNKRDVFMWWKEVLEDYSQFRNCRNKIEEQRLIDMRTAQTISAISSEDAVLGKNKKELDYYLVGGTAVLLLSTAIILNSKK